MNEWREKSLASTAAILEAYNSGQPGPWQLAYSGGKDSTVTAAQVVRAVLMLKPDQRDRMIYITSADTGIDLTTYPTKLAEFRRMERLIKRHDLPMEIAEVKAPIKDNMIFLILGMGYPLPAKGRQWCTERMKILPQQRFVAESSPVLTLLGVRASETVARGELAIHAGKKIDKEACQQEDIRRVLAGHGYTTENLPTGAVIATATMVFPHQVEEDNGSIAVLSDGSLVQGDEIWFGDFSLGRYVWELTDVKQLPQPIPAKGQQGLWNWKGVQP